MLKGLSRLWWRGAKRIGKAQQSQYKKLVKGLQKSIAPTKPAHAKSAASKRPSVATSQSKSQSAENSGTRLPGKWIASYITSLGHDVRLPARRMHYWIYLPRSAAASALPLPMVVMLHGCEQTVSQFAQGTRMNKLAEERGFAVLYPQQSLRGNTKRCWPWYDRITQQGGGDVQLIVTVIDTVIAKYPIDTTRIYIAGMSAGAAMAHILALTRTERFAAVGLHSGPVFGGARSSMSAYAVMQGGSVKAANNAMIGSSLQFRNIPAILIHGDADRIVRPVNQMQLAQQFKILNHLSEKNSIPEVVKNANRGDAKNAPHLYRLRDYVVKKKLLLRICRVEGLGHAWSGGNCTLPYNDCAGPDASKMMWDFFERK